MKMRMLAACCALAIVTTTGVHGAEPMEPSRLGEALIPNDDKTFFENAASGGMFEVEAGTLAVTRGGSQKVKDFGQMMVADHSKAGEELKGLAAEKGISVPDTLMRRHRMMLDELKDEGTPAEFDEAFRRAMIVSHKEAITLFSNAAKNSKDTEVKAFADKTLPTLTSHGTMAKDL